MNKKFFLQSLPKYKEIFYKKSKKFFIKKKKFCFYNKKKGKKNFYNKKVNVFYNNLGIRRVIIYFTVSLMI